MADESGREPQTPGNAEDPETLRRRQDFTRRALIRAGWVVPLVTTVNIPAASAQTPAPHNDVHGDAPHGDEIQIHADIHVDTPAPPHSDFSDHDDAPHTDTPHTDVPHSDTPPHTDAPHSDTPTPHTDVPHSDTPPHTDVPHSDTPPHTDVPHDDTPAHGDHSDAGVHLDAHGDAHGDHDDHTDGHADFIFQGPHRRRPCRPSRYVVPWRSHRHQQLLGPSGPRAPRPYRRRLRPQGLTGLRRSLRRQPPGSHTTRHSPIRIMLDVPYSDHPDAGHRDHDDTDYGHRDHTDIPYSDHLDMGHRDHTDSSYRTHAQHQDHTDIVHNDHADGIHIDAHSDTTPPHVDSHTDEHTDGFNSPGHVDLDLHTDVTHFDTGHVDFHGDSGAAAAANHVDVHGDSGRRP